MEAVIGVLLLMLLFFLFRKLFPDLAFSRRKSPPAVTCLETCHVVIRKRMMERREDYVPTIFERELWLVSIEPGTCR